ncbi:hypothetical protein HYX04_00790 [Candidatus Woesearchaeota archaeon]|nr:hypothetical protein [Candidatus Woesearchaeota archaeon]
MKAIHSLGILSLNRAIGGNAGFLLTNKKGSYCSLYNAPSSRYQGLFYFDEKTMDMHKFIESIEVADSNNISSLKNGFYFAERAKGDVIESFFMPNGLSSLVYELSGRHEIDLILDCKLSTDNREWGRYYEISEEDGKIIVKFTKKTDRREDSSDGAEEFVLYLAIKGNNDSYQKNDKWIERHYSHDEERNSPPFKRHVYNALRLTGSRFVFSMSKNKNNAIKECQYIFDNLEEIKNNEKRHFFEMLKNEAIKKILKNDRISNEVKIAYLSSLNSINNLIVGSKAHRGIFAGFPWFFQFWARDTLISLKALSKIDADFAEKLLFEHLNKISNDGRLPDLAGKHGSAALGNADAHGWLFLRCREIVENMNNNKEIITSIKKSVYSIRQNKNAGSARIKEYLKKCSSIISKKEYECNKMVYEVESSIEKSLNGLLKFHTKDSFEVNGKLETWMDTEFENDKREGVRIEIQALRLNIYKLMFELTQNQKYKVLENLLKIKVREKFWNGKTLADGLNDFTIRPNIFIAAYIYPELLTNKEWETCFDNSLKALWLDWGGLSTIDRSNPLYTDTSTGENVKSYHRGDSWFWINNLAALTMNKINKNKFKKNIQKIIDASAEEILWKGCIGCHSELSSAKELRSEGCFNQAWSNAMFIEMVDEVFGNN